MRVGRAMRATSKRLSLPTDDELGLAEDGLAAFILLPIITNYSRIERTGHSMPRMSRDQTAELFVKRAIEGSTLDSLVSCLHSQGHL